MFFLTGLVWLPLRIVGMIRDGSSAFFILGIVFVAVGFSHKKDWKENHIPFKELPQNGKRLTIIGLVILVLLFLAVLAIVLTTNN